MVPNRNNILMVSFSGERLNVTKRDSSGKPAQGIAGSVTDAVSALTRESWMTSAADANTLRQLNANERTSLTALIAYLAHHSGETEFRIERRLSDRFNVPNMTCLPSTQFDDAIRYLVDAMPIPAASKQSQI
jgi:hypothetical protein